MAKFSSKVFSVFDLINRIAAEKTFEKYPDKTIRIPLDQIPDEHKRNDAGSTAYFAIMISSAEAYGYFNGICDGIQL